MRMDQAAHHEYEYDAPARRMDPREWIAQFIPEPGYNTPAPPLPVRLPLRTALSAVDELPEAA